MTTLTEDLKKLILAGIGAAAVTAEKSKEMIKKALIFLKTKNSALYNKDN